MGTDDLSLKSWRQATCMAEKSGPSLAAIIASLGIITLVACRTPTETVTVEVTKVVVETVVKTVDVAVEVPVEVEPTLSATREASSAKEITICMPHEPASLYPYAIHDLPELAVLHGIYENDFTTLSFAYQPQGLEQIPSLSTGSAVVVPVEVREGDTIVDANGEVLTLKEGTSLITSDGQELFFDGTGATMNQMVVDFAMKQRFWSDNTPVTANDSVYSFKVYSDPDTPTPKHKIMRTAGYEATGDLSVRWTGIPGYLDESYFTNFWRPLPGHIWDKYSAAELLETEASSRLPVGDGPFKIVEWKSGQSIRLTANEHYYRADEGLPHLDSVTFNFIRGADTLEDQMLLGECDIVTHDGIDVSQAPLLFAAEQNGLLVPRFQTGTIYEHIVFGINSWGRYGDGDRRPDWFEDVRVRRAMVMCTDRRAIVEELLYGQSVILHSYVPASHPLYPPDLREWPYDVETANELLDEAGYLDTNEDGIRQDPITGRPFHVTLETTSNYAMNLQIGQAFRSDLRDCGIDIELRILPASEWLARGSESPLFGRRFDLGLLAWPVGEQPLCELFSSRQITGPAGETNRQARVPYGGWNAANASGWWHPEFDAACDQARSYLPGTVEYEENHKKAQRIFAQQVPVIPLFLRLKVAATSPHVLNFKLNPTQPSELWNLFELDLQQ